MAETKSTKKNQPMLDPIAYRSDYPEEWIIWWTPATTEVTDKYVGEGTNNVYNPYNKDIMIADLDPNYQYGQPAKNINAVDDKYITTRNDNIASALYNEWKVSYNDVVNFLQWQQNWYNSTENDRATTISNVWNRLWQISADNKKEDTKADTSRMESDLNKDTSGVIYGKTTADSGNPEKGIQTSSDVNSAFKTMNEARIANVKTLLWMPPQQIAAALYSNTIPSDMQAMVDYQSYYPELWAEVQQYLKQYQWQDTVNAIASWADIPTNTNWTSAANNNIADFAADNAWYSSSMQDILKDVHQTLSSNTSASAANETMADIEEEMAVLNNRLKNLTKEANTVFKWDVPDYLVKAYVNNKTQEIQNQLSILSERYKYASSRYDKEVANAQWEKEYSLKERQVAVQEWQLALDAWKEKNGVSTTTTTTVNTNPTKSTSLSGRELPMTTHTRSEISAYIDQLVDMYNNWQIWNAQCWVWVQTYYLPFLWVSFGSISDRWNKLAMRNEWRDYTPQKWDIIIMASWTAPANWHMGIVTWITADGKVEYLDWNWLNGKKAEEPALRTIDPKSAKIQGYYNATKWFSEETASWSQWSDYDYTRFEQYRDATSETVKKAIAAEYWTTLQWMNNIVREALTNRNETVTDNPWELTWFDYVWLTDDQIADIEKKIWYNPNIEWELKKIIDKGIPTSWPAMQNVLKTVRAKDEKQLWQWIDHYQNKVNAEAAKAWEDILLLLAQLQNAYKDAGKLDEVTENWKTKIVFDTNITHWWGWHETWIKYEQLINQLLLNKVTEAREKWATFWQMTEYEWKILKDAASALKIKFWLWSSDESFSNAFFDLVDATWKLTNWTNTWPTASEWEKYVKQVKKESEWYMTWASTKEISKEDAQSWLNSWRQWWTTTWWRDDYVSNYSILQ